MTRITVTPVGSTATPERRRRALVPLSVEEIEIGDLQEGQDLDFKREVNLDKPEGRSRLLDDIVAFLNRGAGRIIVGVEEREGQFGGFRPLAGDADKVALRVQGVIQDAIMPLPVDVQVVPLRLDQGFILDIQIPPHLGGPFMNRLSGGYLIRSGARNLPIDPGTLRSRFVDETAWMARLDELTAAEDARVPASGRFVLRQALRIGILPREHFDHRREPFAQADHVRYPGPVFHEHSDPMFKVAEDGHELYSKSFRDEGLERLFIRDDWFIHAHAGFAIQQRQGEGRLGLHEFNEATRRYLGALGVFLAEQAIEGPFAITLSLHGLAQDDHFFKWFPNTTTVRTLRPRLVAAVDEPDLVAEFLRRVRQATIGA